MTNLCFPSVTPIYFSHHIPHLDPPAPSYKNIVFLIYNFQLKTALEGSSAYTHTQQSCFN